MSVVVARHWSMLSMLPRPPRCIDTGALETRLHALGYRVHRRTIQRDLVELARFFPIVADARHKPYGWRWKENSSALLHARVERGPRTMALRLRVQRALVDVVTEGLGSVDVEVHPDPADDARFAVVVVTAEDTVASRRFVFGFGSAVEVLGPSGVRRDLAERARLTRDLYWKAR